MLTLARFRLQLFLVICLVVLLIFGLGAVSEDPAAVGSVRRVRTPIKIVTSASSANSWEESSPAYPEPTEASEPPLDALLETALATSSAKQLGLASLPTDLRPRLLNLLGQCSEHETNGSRYRLCPFLNVTRADVFSDATPLHLGVYSQWMWRPAGHRPLSMQFWSGASCGVGQRWQAELHLQCSGSPELRLEDVQELPNCMHQLTASTSLACVTVGSSPPPYSPVCQNTLSQQHQHIEQLQRCVDALLQTAARSAPAPRTAGEQDSMPEACLNLPASSLK